VASYAPPQPFWKRDLAGILNFSLAVSVFGTVLYLAFGSQPRAPVTKTGGPTEIFSLGPWPTLALLVLVIAYFVVLGRTGGTVFQRLFGMRRLG
jgi:hypothetical protein